MRASFRGLLYHRLDDAAGLLRETPEFVWRKQAQRVDGHELKDHPRPRRVVEGVCQLFVSLLNKAEDSQVALMMTPGIIANESLEVVENALAESLQRHLAKF